MHIIVCMAHYDSYIHYTMFIAIIVHTVCSVFMVCTLHSVYYEYFTLCIA